MITILIEKKEDGFYPMDEVSRNIIKQAELKEGFNDNELDNLRFAADVNRKTIQLMVVDRVAGTIHKLVGSRRILVNGGK